MASCCRTVLRGGRCTAWRPVRSSAPSTRWARPLSAGCARRRARTALPRRRHFRCSPAAACARGGGQGRSGGQPGAAARSRACRSDGSRQRRQKLSAAGLHRHLRGGGRRLAGLSGPFRHAAPGERRHDRGAVRSWACSPCCSPATMKTPPRPSPPAGHSAGAGPTACRRIS